MRTKYNEQHSYIDITLAKSNIYRKYKKYIEILLTSSLDSYNNYKFDDLYVVPKGIEDELREYKSKGEINSFLYLTGLTGTGKTSLLKYIFRHFENKFCVEGTTLVIPFTCDNNIGDKDKLKKRLANLFFAVVEWLCQEYNLKDFRENAEEFRVYIRERKSQFSVNQKGWGKISAEELLTQLYENEVLELSIFALKYTMSQENNPINNVVFIMDDVESVGINLEIYPIYLANKIMSCLVNRTKAEQTKWTCNTIVACRHYVYRMLRTKHKTEDDENLLREVGIDRSTMESFWGTDLDLSAYPALKEIVEKRALTIRESLPAEQQVEFDEVCTVLYDIIDQVGNLLLESNIYDYRRTLQALKKLIYNRRWLQRYPDVSGAFRIGTAEDSYFRNRANIIRAIAMREQDVYFGKDSVIPNLLQNTNCGGDLWKLLLAGLFASDKTHSWSFSMDCEALKTSIKKLFDGKPDYINDFNDALTNMIEDRLLLRGKKEEQRDSIDLDLTDASAVRYVYPSGMLKLLWDILAENSVLFEMYVDDVWMEEPYRKDADSGKRYIQFNLPNYRECQNYLETLIRVENEIRTYVNDTGRKDTYCEYFGEIPVSKQLYLGLKNSFTNYFREKMSGEEFEQRILEIKLSKLEEQLEECEKKLE